MVVYQLSWLWAFGWPALRACRSGRCQPDLRLRGGEARRRRLEHCGAWAEPWHLFRGGAYEGAARARCDSGNALRQLRRAWRRAISLVADGLLLNGRYDSAGIAPTIKVPALFVLAERDDVTPVEHGAALAHAWAEPQRTITLAGARHYGIERSDEFWNAVAEFLRQIESAPRHNGYGF